MIRSVRNIHAASAILVFLASFALSPAAAQDNPAPLRVGKNRFVTLTVENDSLGRGTDHNYTSGVRISLLDTGAEIPEFVRRTAGLIPAFEINETTSFYYSLGHNLYTPDDVEQSLQDPEDRPWAAFLYGSAGIASLAGNHVDELEMTLGVIGPLAQGERIQKFVHDAISAKDPNGWDNQLENEPGLILSWQRRWPWFYHLERDGFQLSMEPHGGMALGNVYTYAGGGITARFGPAAVWQDTPPRVRPAIPGTGFFTAPPSNRLSWFVFAGTEVRGVARNIFLDGNTFEGSHSVDKRPFVADANAGMAFTWGRARVSYALNWRSKEFDGQDRGDLFGTVSIGYGF